MAEEDEEEDAIWGDGGDDDEDNDEDDADMSISLSFSLSLSFPELPFWSKVALTLALVLLKLQDQHTCDEALLADISSLSPWD